MAQLSNKVAIITGASSGIGRAAARLFSSEGAAVVLAARRERELAEVAHEIRMSGGRVAWLAGDVCEEAYAKALVELAHSAFGGLDVAFNNAGGLGPMAATPEVALEDWEAALRVNLTSALLARKVGLSPFHAHRLFKLATGVTPRGYFNAWRGERLRRELLGSSSVTEAIYGAGFNSSGRFYAEAPARLGMTPSRFRAGGAAERIRFALGECSLGSILVAASERGVCAIALADQPEPLLRELEQQFAQAELIGGDRAFERLVAQVVGLVEQPWRVSELPLDIRGTAFQERVWQALRRLGPGTTLTYGELAKRVGAPTAVRAVAGACASNRVAVAIPCHRVVRADGALSGYRWGVERKRQLLQREAVGTRPSTTEVTAPQKAMV